MHIPAPVTLVTGSSRGLGFAIANEFQERGDKVHVVWRNSADREEALLEQFSQRTHHCDLASQEATLAMVERLLEIDGKLDHVVHCIGDYHSAPLSETSMSDWRALFESNLATAIHLSEALREPMRETGGTLVFFACSGVAELRGRRTIAAYAAMKSALMVFARSLALEEAPFGVRVNTISPGLIPHADAHADTRSDRLHAHVPLGRAGTPEEVAAAALWLSSSDSGYAVGLDLPVSGGW